MSGGDKFFGINRDEKRQLKQRESQSVRVSESISGCNSAQINSVLVLRESSRIHSSTSSRYSYVRRSYRYYVLA